MPANNTDCMLKSTVNPANPRTRAIKDKSKGIKVLNMVFELFFAYLSGDPRHNEILFKISLQQVLDGQKCSLTLCCRDSITSIHRQRFKYN